MTSPEIRRRWRRWRARVRRKTARITPQVVTCYPFEVFALLIALLMGLPFLLGMTLPPALIAVVSHVAVYAWSAALAIGSVTVGVGLRGRNPLVIASGLQLLAGCFGVYALAIVAVLGLAGWTGAVAYLSLTLVCLVRSTYFRRLIDIQRGNRRLEDE